MAPVCSCLCYRARHIRLCLGVSEDLRMRVDIGYEGHETEDGRTILPGALTWGELPLPVFNYEGSGSPYEMRKIIGHIVELERVGNVIQATMDIDIPAGYVLSLDGADADLETVEKEDGSFNVIFKSMRIAGGTLIPEESWAWKK